MVACAQCGVENPDGAKFCNECGARLGGQRVADEQRKTVTVLFCDVTGSTALGERIDPESLRRVLARYFEVMSGAIERHGGSVEKFIGDAVMAVFGVPVVHEDDALRALRAAAEMRAALEPLNAELAGDYGTTLQARIGVNTGEVVTGTEERLATGDAVNVAARLQQAAEPGEILLGVETMRLAHDVIVAEQVEPLSLKGKGQPVAAYRLASVGVEEPTRRLDVRMVGRERELRRLREAFAQAVDDRSCQLFTILGAAGVGKSRLVYEFLSALTDATVLRGRCVAYGEGITYWPVVEVVKQLEVSVESVEPPIRSLLGETDRVTSAEEIAWAVRKVLESAAGEQPVVCVFDDVHWGEDTFLDLVEHVADLSRDAPLLVLCMARPELLDRRPAWGGGKLNATTVLLEPLDEAETDALVDELLAGRGVADEVRRRVREAAEGNPLFAEEMVALLESSDAAEVTVPPTVQALLAARLDQLEPPERGVLERGSVEGRVFHRGAVEALAPGETQVLERLSSLVRKELVRPERAQLPGEDAYRFRHLLIRDAAYEALPKAARAGLHERFADWLAQNGQTLVELDELVGYHLEQAHRYRAELGPLAQEGIALGRRAAERLAAAGQRAADVRGDLPAAANLFERAGALLPADDAGRLRIQPDLAAALVETGAFERAEEVLERAIEAAQAAGDEEVEAETRLLRVYLHLQTDPTHDFESARAEAERLIAILERLGDDRGLASAWGMLGKVLMWLGRCEAAIEAQTRSLDFAERAGDHRARRQALVWLLLSCTSGPLPAEEEARRVEEIRRDSDAGGEVEAMALIAEGGLEAMQRRFAEARRSVTAGRALNEELGLAPDWAGSSMYAGRIELLAGDPAAAERVLREGADELQRLGETGYFASVAAVLAEATLAQGRLEEAVRLSEASERAAAPDDVDAQGGWRMVRAQALAQQGALAEAERLAREAVTLLETTDFLARRADAQTALAAVLRLAGRTEEAAAALEQALALYERKGNLVSAAATRTAMDELANIATSGTPPERQS